MNIHKSQLFWCELQGYKVLTHCHVFLFPESPKAGGFWAWFEHVLTVDLPVEAMNWCLAQARLAVPLAVAGAFHTDFMVGRAGDVEKPTIGTVWTILIHFGPFWTNMFYNYVLWLSRWLGIFYPNWRTHIFQRDWNHQPLSDWQLHSEFDVISRLFKTFQANLQLGENLRLYKNTYKTIRDSSRQSCLKFHSSGGVPCCVPPTHPVDDRWPRPQRWRNWRRFWPVR